MYQCWGINNREVPLRVPIHPLHGATNVEFKSLDHTDNPYLALGCLIRAGAEGIRYFSARRKTAAETWSSITSFSSLSSLSSLNLLLNRSYTLPDPIQCDPANLTIDELGQKGIAALPRSLSDALQALERDEVLVSALGSRRTQTYLSVKRAEVEYLKNLENSERFELLMNRY